MYNGPDELLLDWVQREEDTKSGAEIEEAIAMNIKMFAGDANLRLWTGQ